MDPRLRIAKRRRQIDINVLRGVAVRDVARVNDPVLFKVRVPSHVNHLSVRIMRQRVQIQIHSSVIIPVDKKPQIPHFFRNADGELLKSFDRVLVAQTISPETSSYVKDCLRAVVVYGSGMPAAIPGYKIAGKTGTAQKYDKEEDLYVISFIGFAPFENPEVLCYVAIDEPTTGDVSRYASELFARIMTNVLSYMNIAPDDLG